jgi:electron-transferring-flavoprotein dehydrogenase
MSRVEREELPFDVVFVGAGPASLAGALHLANLVRRHNAAGGGLGEVEIAVIEKGAEVGAHGLSGAVMDPVALAELVPDFLERGCPLEAPVGEDAVLYLTETGKFRLPVTPPPMRNHGYYVASLAKLLRWLAPICEEAGVNVFPEFPGVALLYDGDAVVGVRTGDKGVGKDGAPKANFEPGVDLRARAVVLGEGPRGTLTKELVARLRLDAESDPQVYALGVKEIWELPDDRLAAGTVYHTLGFPHPGETFGGGFIYMMSNRLLDVGLVTGLDYRDPRTDPHGEFQRFKAHPWVRSLLEGGRMVGYGAKAIPEGGYHTIPRLYADGCLIVGDSGGLLNGQRLKGIHLAMKSGMLAAETIFEGLVADDLSARRLSGYTRRVRESYIEKELFETRNFHQGFERGRAAGVFNAGLAYLTRGAYPATRHARAGHLRMRTLEDYYGGREPRGGIAHDGKLTFDKVTDVYHSGTHHDEDQPCHLKVVDTSICVGRCTREYGNPCERFCPAAVYEMVEDAKAEAGRRLQVNFSNCVHCKTCDIMDPYQIINWTPPEGGGGPNYKHT